MEALARAMPFEGFLGGLLIGVGAALMLLGAGRIAGVSGLAAGAVGLARSSAPRNISIAFIIGLPLGALTIAALSGPLVIRYSHTPWILIAGGLLVGFGSRLGSGCTSGHGVCGISRFSRRSLVATAVFIATGAVTVAAMNALGAS